MGKFAQIAVLLFLLCFVDQSFCQDSSVVISFDNPDLIAALEELLSKHNVSTSIEEVFECTQDPPPCDIKATCTDVSYSYSCTCQNGYTGSFTKSELDEDTIHSCTDIDECEILRELNELILNQLDRWSMEIQECKNNNLTIDYKLETREVQNFTGMIEQKYEVYGVVDNRRNSLFQMYSNHIEAEILNNLTSYLPCDTSSTCINHNATYQCTCDSGLVGDVSGCVDVDECDADSSLCDGKPNTSCMNLIGSYICACPDGYQYSDDVRDCVDINECELNITEDCFACNNTLGSYQCYCPEGFTGDDRNCIYTGECPLDNDCSTNADCINEMGSYRCVCKTGYTGDGQICFEITPDDCLTSSLPTCSNVTTSLSCQYAIINPTKAQRVYEAFSYFFHVPEAVTNASCAAGDESSFFHITDDPSRICDIEYGYTWRTIGYMNEEDISSTEIEIYHFDNHFQWFDVRTCKEKHTTGSSIGCVQRYLTQRALTIEKRDGKFQFDVKQVYFESGCEVDLFI